MSFSDIKYQSLKFEPVNQTVDEQNEADLLKILKEVKELNEINAELSVLLNEQDNGIGTIVETQEQTIHTTDNTNNILENIATNKFKMVPVVLGGVVGAAVFGPGAMLLGAKTGVAYIAAGGGIIGSIAGKKLS